MPKQPPQKWNGIPWFPINQYYQEKLGGKFQKLPVTIASDCPNRRGLKGMTTCIFCDEWGSSPYPEQQAQELRRQIQDRIEATKERLNTPNFLAYFQAYTSTFIGAKKLRESFDVALSFPEIKGLVIGTRPDCLSKAVLELWNDFAQKTHVSVEFGIQSFFDDQLDFLRRGHNGASAIDSIWKVKKETSVDVGIHLIFGLPGETDDHLIRSAEITNDLPVDNVKLHNLHVLKDTPLHALWKTGDFVPIELEEYARRVGLFLTHLRPNIAVHRVTAMSNRWNELIAPEWTKHKMRSYQYVWDYFEAKHLWQGKHYSLRRSQPTITNPEL